MFYYRLKTSDGKRFCGHCNECEDESAIKAFLLENPSYSENDVIEVVITDD